MTQRYRVMSAALPPLPPQLGAVMGQLQGMVNQAQALANAGVGLPGLNDLGNLIKTGATSLSSLTTLGSTFTAQLQTLGQQMATGAMGGMSGIISQMQTQLSGLTGLLNPGGLLATELHSHMLDKAAGVVTSAFTGQHSTLWSVSGLLHMSAQKVANMAPMIPLNGNIFGSDNFTLTKALTAASVGTSSDARLKTNVEPMAPVLDRVMQVEVKTFFKHYIHTNGDGEQSVSEDGDASFGFIAQDFREHFPELVRGDEAKEFLTLDEAKVGIVAIAALKEFILEQRAEIAELKQQIADLQATKG